MERRNSTLNFPPVSDHFATLHQPRLPWLEPAALKESFHRLGAAAHPDSPGGDAAAFAAINAAWLVLRDPAARLRHLLELQAPALLARSAEIPSALAAMFMQLAALRREHEGFRLRAISATGPLATALLAGEKIALERRTASALAQLDTARDAAIAELQALDETWAATPESLAALYQQLSFLGKWSAQFREALFELKSREIEN